MEANPAETLPATATVPQSQFVENLITQAVLQKMDITTIERFMALRKEYKAELAKEAYDAALAAFQAQCPIIEKDKPVIFNGKIQYKYAPIDSIHRQLDGLPGKHGFSQTYRVENTPDGVKGICRNTHMLGHFEESDFTADMKGTNMMSNAQITSSKATFAKRNAFCNVLGIVTGDEDDDGHQSIAETMQENLATEEQKAKIDALATEAGLTKAQMAQRFKELYKSSIVNMTKVQAEGVIKGLQDRIANTV